MAEDARAPIPTPSRSAPYGCPPHGEDVDRYRDLGVDRVVFWLPAGSPDEVLAAVEDAQAHRLTRACAVLSHEPRNPLPGMSEWACAYAADSGRSYRGCAPAGDRAGHPLYYYTTTVELVNG